MNEKIETQRSKEKKELLTKARKLGRFLSDTGIKQGVLAARMKISQNTLSRFMSEEKGYVTKSLVGRIEIYIEKTFEKVIK